MQPVAYIRKSKVNPNGHALSWEVQEAQVRDLAARNGDGDRLTLLSDWGTSGAAAASAFGGTGRGGKRKVWGQLVEMIDAGQVSALYAYSLSRLARSTRELLDLAERCARSGVVVRLAVEGTLDFTTAHGRLYLTVLAAVATFEAEVSAARAKDQVMLRRTRGDHIGQPPYGYRLEDRRLVPDPDQPIEPVLEAYREAGTYHGAARLLNERGLPSRNGTPWSDMTVRRIVGRTDTVSKSSRPGRPTKHPALLAGLLRCPCGQTLTPTRDTNRLADGTMATYQHYICWRARHDSTHPKPSKVSEAQILPWVKAEAARFRTPPAVETDRRPATDQGPDRSELTDRRQRALYQHQRRYITDVELDALMADIDAQLERMDASEQVVRVVPNLDWSWSAEAVNDFLRAIWNGVNLDERLRPINADWAVPPEYVE